MFLARVEWLPVTSRSHVTHRQTNVRLVLGVHLVQSSLSFITCMILCMILCMRPIVRKRSLRSNVTLPRLVVKKVSATLEKMLPCYGLRFAGEASSNLKSHSTKFGHYPCSHFANTTPAVHVVHHHHHHVHGKFNSMRLYPRFARNNDDTVIAHAHPG